MSTQTVEKRRDIFITPRSEEDRDSRNEFIGFMLFFYLIPVLLLYFEIFPFGAHNVIIPLTGFLIIAYTIEKDINYLQLGFNKRNPLRGLFVTLSVTAVMFTLLILSSRLGLGTEAESVSIPFILFYVLISAPIQEFIFRSVMHYEFGLIYGKGREILKVFSTAIIFALAHSFFKSIEVLIGTFILGLIWGYLYSKYRNFWPIALSHAILGTTAVILGIL